MCKFSINYENLIIPNSIINSQVKSYPYVSSRHGIFSLTNCHLDWHLHHSPGNNILYGKFQHFLPQQFSTKKLGLLATNADYGSASSIKFHIASIRFLLCYLSIHSFWKKTNGLIKGLESKSSYLLSFPHVM